MGIELFKMMADIDFKVIQFKGGGPVMIDVLGGHSDACMSALMQTLPHIKSGKFRVLGTSGLKRSVALPDVPTISEAGVPGYESSMWWGIVAPAGTPAPIVARLNKELEEILALDEIKKWFLTQGAEEDFMNSADFGLFLQKDIPKWASVIKKANIKLEE
jgi:tripartite-type tricarboxylate transporter receptor subunit TctC